MTTDVKTTYHTERYGTMIAVATKIVNKAIKTNDVLHINHKGQVMTMDPQSLKNKNLYTTTFQAKDGSGEYDLNNYRWNPNDTYDD